MVETGAYKRVTPPKETFWRLVNSRITFQEEPEETEADVSQRRPASDVSPGCRNEGVRRWSRENEALQCGEDDNVTGFNN